MSSINDRPIIPQTVDQAIQRDQAADLADSIPLTGDPAVELQQLQQAIRDHRETILAHKPGLRAQGHANEILWGHISE